MNARYNLPYFPVIYKGKPENPRIIRKNPAEPSKRDKIFRYFLHIRG